MDIKPLLKNRFLAQYIMERGHYHLPFEYQRSATRSVGTCIDRYKQYVCRSLDSRL